MQEDINWEELTTPLSQTLFRKDRHLSTALITSEIKYVVDNQNNPLGLKREHRDLLARIKGGNVTVLPSEAFIPWFATNWKKTGDTNKPLTPLTTALKVASHATRISIKDYVGHEHTPDFSLTPFIVDVYNVKRNFDIALEDLSFTTATHISYSLGSVKCEAYGNLHLIWIGPTTCYVITHSHLVCVRDMVNAWFSVLIYSRVYQNKYPDIDFYEEIIACLSCGQDLLSSRGQAAFKMFKLWPSLTIACVLRDQEGKDDFFNTLVKDIHYYKNTSFFQWLTRPIRNAVEVQLRLELSGL